MAVLGVTLLGYPTISINGQQIQQEIPDKAIALLSYVAMTGQTHRRDVLAGILWGNKVEGRARNSLSIVLNKLRKYEGIEAQLLVSRREIGLIEPDSFVCDATQFAELAARPDQQTLAQLEEAAALYSGPFLDGFQPNDSDGSRDYLAWAQQQQVRIEQLALNLFTTLIDRYKERGDLAKAITYAQRVLNVDPLMESAQRDLMLLLAQNGQSEQAIAQYQECQRLLEKELGIEPDDETQALHQDILDSRKNSQRFTQSDQQVEESLFDRMPMRPYDVLFGRKQALSQLLRHLSATNSGQLTNLYGIGGLGKSSLAYMAVNQLITDEQVSHLAWIEVESTHHLTEPLPADLLFEDIIHRLIANIPSITASAPTHAQRVRQVRKVLQSDPWLIVIDNIENFDDDGTLSEHLFSLADPSRFLIMSRTRINAVRPIHALPLEPINKESALSCVRTRAGALGQDDLTGAKEDLLNRLFELVGGHPQALLLFVQTAIYISPEEIVEQFENTEVQTISDFYDKIYRRIWATISTDAQQLLDTMRLSPAQGMPEDYLAAVCRLSRNDYWQASRELSDASLLIKRTVGGETRQYMHSLTGSFLRSMDRLGARSDISAENRTEQISAACAWWQEKAAEMDGLAFEAAHPYLLKVIEMGLGRSDNCLESAELAAAYKMPMYTSMLWRQWLPIYTQALTITPDSNAKLKMTLLSATGLLHDTHDDYSSAIKHHQQALVIAKSLSIPTDIARHNVNLALSYKKSHKLDQASHHLEKAIDIINDREIQGLIPIAAYNLQADIAHLRTQFETVFTYCEQAIQHRGSTETLHAIANTYNTWAHALLELNQLEEAKEKYNQSFELNTKINHQSGQIIAKIGLLDCYLLAENLDCAERIIASSHFRQLDETLSPTVSAHIAEFTGRYHLLNNDQQLAISFFEQAIPLWKEANLPVDLGKTFALMARANAKTGTKNKAIEFENKAALLFAEGGRWGKFISQKFPPLS